MQLDGRKIKILELIIDRYIRFGEPVSSKTISQMFQNSISAATVRNEMAKLYEFGFLEQPHTSAGRIPSQLGYRLYIDRIMKKKSLSEVQTKQIESWFNVKNPDYSSLIENAGKLLSKVTVCMTILSSMVFQALMITKIEIIEIAEKTLAVILITSSGVVKSRVCKLDFDLTADSMEFIYKLVNNVFSGKSVEEVSRDYINSVVSNLNNYQMFFVPVFYNIYEMCKDLHTSDFYIEGQTNLLLYKELKETASDIINVLSDKSVVADLLAASLESGVYSKGNCEDFGYARVLFGRELKMLELSNICLIVSRYNIGNIGTGNILVVGPDRLDYSLLVPWVEYFSNMLSIVLSELIDIT